ncbi:OmpL47-type beta-barrel domain-containing protein [Bellilinea sp.]|uniref:OmpL47-type beta-barrel domain-containing protein n=1 Tax=Bellilinea sp. TaxID=2838785 RepID=UPI002ADE07E1|nr:hypothetical protein [Bellilinea sp.]
MRSWWSKLSPLAGLAIALVTVTVVIAAYTGPIRPRTVQVQDGYVRTIYRNSPWEQVCRCAYGDPGGRCSDGDEWCYCGDAPYNNTSLYTCYESERYVDVTHNPATVSGSFTCGTWGNNGWCRGAPSVNISANEPVSGYNITWIEGSYGAGYFSVCNPPDASSVNCSWTPPNGIFEGSSKLDFWANSSYGDQSAAQSLSFRVDTGAPSISLSPSGTLGGGGWYRSNVTVTGSGSDSVSGLAGIAMSCGSNPCTVTAEGSTTITATATDNAGNTNSTSLTIRKDTTAPGITFTPSGTAGNGGWYRSNVTLSANATDAASGVASLSLSCGSNPCTITAQGTTNVTATATDVAGNSGNNSTTIRIDSVPPTASLSPSGTLGNNGWYVGNVTVTTNGSDATSGVASTQTRLNGGAWGGSSLTITTDGTHTVEGRTTDVAGNQSSTVSTTIRRDATPPSASLNIPAPNGQNGWFVTSPTVSTDATDATSGVATSQVRLNGGAWQSNATIGTDGVHTVEGRAQDYAGHWSSTVSGTVRVDTTPPTASVSLPPADGQNGWYVSDVTVTALGSDATSGVASRQVSLDGTNWANNDLTITADGTFTATIRVTDVAGNSQTATATIRRDATPPTINGLDVSGTTGNNGWYRSNVNVSGVASDATSGIALVQVDGQSSLNLSEGVHNVLIRAVDEAGNETTRTVIVRVDSTPPDLVPQISATDGQNGWHVVGATLDAAASDALSGLADVRVRVDGGAWQTLPLDLTDEGVYDVEIEAEDEAGNLSTRSLTVRIDRTAPSISPSVPPADGNNGWYVSPFEVSYSTEDNLSGLDTTAWRLNGGAWQSGTPQIDGEGETVLDIRAVDYAGNERIRRYTFNLDQTPPVGEISLTGDTGVEGLSHSTAGATLTGDTSTEEWYRSTVVAVLTGEDAVSGLAEVRLPQTIFDTEGWYTVTGEVEDKAGWVTEVSRSFGIDLTPPQGSFDALPDLLSGTVTLAGDANDVLSGLQRLEISFAMGYEWQEIPFADDRWTYEWDTTQTNGGYKRIYLRLTDKAGNQRTKAVDVLVSNALPQAAITELWEITESGQVMITPGDLPIRQVCLAIQDPTDANRKVEWCGERVEDIPNPVQWDGRFSDGTQAGPGQYPVTVLVADIAGRTVTASGAVIIPAPTPTPTEEPTATKPVAIAVLPTATPTPTPTATPTETPTEEAEEEPTRTPPAVSMVLPTPQPTVAVKPPKFEVQAAVEVIRRALWPFLTLIGLAAALGYSAMRDERPKAIRKLAERMERIKQLQEVK